MLPQHVALVVWLAVELLVRHWNDTEAIKAPLEKVSSP